MRSMRLLWLLAILVLIFAGTAKADTLPTVKVDGTYAFADGVYGIPPYGGSLNGVAGQAFYCVDFSTPISAGDYWTVNITRLTGSNFSLTRLKDQTTYLEMAWLITNMMSAKDLTQKAMYQYAIWSFTGGPTNPYGNNSSLVTLALDAVKKGFSGQGWEILSPTPGSNGQEFLIYVPEPAELLMFFVGLIVLGLVARKKRVARAHAV